MPGRNEQDDFLTKRHINEGGKNPKGGISASDFRTHFSMLRLLLVCKRNPHHQVFLAGRVRPKDLSASKSVTKHYECDPCS